MNNLMKRGIDLSSHDQARKATRKKSHCLVFNILNSVIGLGALSKVGFRVEKRVATYRPALIFSGSPV